MRPCPHGLSPPSAWTSDSAPLESGRCMRHQRQRRAPPARQQRPCQVRLRAGRLVASGRLRRRRPPAHRGVRSARRPVLPRLPGPPQVKLHEGPCCPPQDSISADPGPAPGPGLARADAPARPAAPRTARPCRRRQPRSGSARGPAQGPGRPRRPRRARTLRQRPPPPPLRPPALRGASGGVRRRRAAPAARGCSGRVAGAARTRAARSSAWTALSSAARPSARPSGSGAPPPRG